MSLEEVQVPCEMNGSTPTWFYCSGCCSSFISKADAGLFFRMSKNHSENLEIQGGVEQYGKERQILPLISSVVILQLCGGWYWTVFSEAKNLLWGSQCHFAACSGKLDDNSCWMDPIQKSSWPKFEFTSSGISKWMRSLSNSRREILLQLQEGAKKFQIKST